MQVLLVLISIFVLVFSLPQKIIDGNTSDWTSSETFPGDSSLWGVSWSNGNLYLSVSVDGLTPNNYILIWIDTNPSINASQGTGAQNGMNYIGYTPSFISRPEYHIQYHYGEGQFAIYNFNSGWTFGGSYTTIAETQSFIELEVPLSVLGNPVTIYVCGCVINNQLGSFFADFPVDSIYAPFQFRGYYGFPLLPSQIQPSLSSYFSNKRFFLQTFPAQTVSGGNVWESDTSWVAGLRPSSNSMAWITSLATTSLNTNTTINHLFVDGGSTFLQLSHLFFNDDAYIANYGIFQSSGTIIALGNFQAYNIPFFNLQLNKLSFIDRCVISGRLTMNPNSQVTNNSLITYTSGSTLFYNACLTKSNEWSSQVSGYGNPFNVEIASLRTVTIVDSPSMRVDLIVQNNLIINPGATLSMVGYRAPLYVSGNFTLRGTLHISGDVRGDVYVRGTIFNTGTVICYGESTLYDSFDNEFNKPIIRSSVNTGSIVLQTTQNYSNYLWSTGEISPFIRVNSTSGSFYVNVTDVNGCKATSRVFNITPNSTIGGVTSPITSGVSLTESAQSESDNSENKQVGTIIGSVIGVLALITAIVVIVVLLVRRRKQKEKVLEMETKLEKGSSTTQLVQKNSIERVQASLSNIEVQEKIGQGNFGKVYRGIMSGGTVVALKEIHSTASNIEKEAEILSLLNHPNVVRFYGIFKQPPDEQLMVFEYVNGGSLDIFLRDQNLSIPTLNLISAQIVSGMQYLAAKNIVHGDLAARNVLISKEGETITAKISDFGMARFIEGNMYSLKSKILPVKWTAPEVISYGTVSLKSDIWSFGICLWEIFSRGKIPYPGLSNEEVAKKVADEGKVMEVPLECPPEIGEVMKRCWKKKPEERPSFSEILDIINKLVPTTAKKMDSITNVEKYVATVYETD